MHGADGVDGVQECQCLVKLTSITPALRHPCTNRVCSAQKLFDHISAPSCRIAEACEPHFRKWAVEDMAGRDHDASRRWFLLSIRTAFSAVDVFSRSRSSSSGSVQAYVRPLGLGQGLLCSSSCLFVRWPLLSSWVFLPMPNDQCMRAATLQFLRDFPGM